MIHPELWKLTTNENATNCREVEFTEQNVRKITSTHSFNKMISVFLPDVQRTPVELETVFQDSCHYYSNDLKLEEFINRVFVEAFIKRGRFYCISVGRNLETEDCVAITPSGNLILSLNKESYQSIGGGLKGVLLKHSKRMPSKYFVKLDLKSKDLLPGTKYFENVKKALQHEILSKFHFKFQWIPEQSNICPSSIAKNFADMKYSIKLCRNQFKWSQEYSLKLPKLEKVSKDCGIEEIAEFIGYHTLSCDMDFSSIEESQQSELSHEDCGSARILTWNGFFSTEDVSRLLDTLRNFLNQNSSIPWASIYVHGFEDSPVNFHENPHKFYINGDHSYLMLMKPNDPGIIFYQVTNSNKILK